MVYETKILRFRNGPKFVSDDLKTSHCLRCEIVEMDGSVTALIFDAGYIGRARRKQGLGGRRKVYNIIPKRQPVETESSRIFNVPTTRKIFCFIFALLTVRLHAAPTHHHMSKKLKHVEESKRNQTSELLDFYFVDDTMI